MIKNGHIQKFISAVLLAMFLPMSVSSAASYSTTAAYNSAPCTSSVALDGTTSLTNNNVKINLSLRDSDIKQVMRMFADRVGMNVVFHSSVDGKITLDLVDTPINSAFDLVLQISGLNYYKQNNTLIIISKSDPANVIFSKQEMMVFPVKYVAASKIADFLNRNVFSMQKTGLSGVDAATVNAATNEIIVFGMPSDVRIVQKVIQQLDREPLTKTFAVNHTTPAEMADMICNMLLPARGVSADDKGDGEFKPQMPGVSTGGAAGVITGGAASSGGGSSTEMKLGEGVVACSISQAPAGATSSPFNMQGISISYYPQRGTIIMMGGSEAQMYMVEKFIRDNDVKQPQAYLEMSIVELNEQGSKEFNNTWGIQSRNWFMSFSGSNTIGGRRSYPGNSNPLETIRYYHEPIRNASGAIIGYEEKESNTTDHVQYHQWYSHGPYISWTVNYLIENKKGRVLANPKLLITNGQESTLDLTSDYVEKVTSEFLSSTSTGSGATGSVQRNYSIGNDQGIKIVLTPFISPDGYVTMNIKPEYATVSGTVTAPSGYRDDDGAMIYDLQATLLSRRNLDLKNVRIKDGETLVIGGLIQEVETKSTQKIPVLGDLPIIGSAFRSTQTSKTKSELILMITPRIINDGEDSVADSL